jgi:hypothetical protein
VGIHTKFSGNAQTIDLRSIADEMLAEVVAKHAAERFAVANRANSRAAGGDIAYTVTVNGRVVSRGKGDIFPVNQVAVAVRRTPGRRHSVIIDWLWHQLQAVTLQRAITAIGQIDDAVTFARVLVNPRNEMEAMFGFLWRLYLQRYVSPTTARFISKAWERSHYARAAYRFYRQMHLAGMALPGGRAEADPDVLAWIADELRARSPVVTGAYRDAHALYGDGRMLMAASDITADSDVPEAKEYSFSNTMPYSRKIEFGKTADGRDFVLQVPNRIYERVAQDARARFPDVQIAYEMRAVIDAVQTPQRAARRQHNVSEVRYPSIVVRF